jgi:isoaspartyl peptidase/L-asparaginase-like protein (Ntn-hydrolase superfamily)
VVLAKTAAEILKSGGGPKSAADQSVALLAEKIAGSTGGLIMIDRHGKIGYARNTTHMPVCFITGTTPPTTDS